MDVLEAKKSVLKAGLELLHSGLIARTWGNVSCRVDSESFVITPSGREYDKITEDDMVLVKISDLSYEGQIKPSSEKGIHASVYMMRPDINFVIHTHQEYASAVSAANIDFFETQGNYKKLGDRILLAKYALPGTKALRKNVESALIQNKSNAYILKHHGALCLGKDYESTFEAASLLESACKEFLTGADNFFNSISTIKTGSKIIINDDPFVVRYSLLKKPMFPMLDDFAQIVGTKIKCIDLKSNLADINLDEKINEFKKVSAFLIKEIGAVCYADNEADAQAVNFILGKNAKAYFAAKALGKVKKINTFESYLMRKNYILNYSKMTDKNK